MMNVMDLECGVTLQLIACKPAVLKDLLFQFGGDAFLRNPAILKTLPEKKQLEMLELQDKMLSYCAGWGVTNEVGNNDDELAELMGYGRDKPHLRRAQWVKSICTEKELSELLGRVLALTFGKAKEIVTQRPLYDSVQNGNGVDERIAALQAEIESLQGK